MSRYEVQVEAFVSYLDETNKTEYGDIKTN